MPVNHGMLSSNSAEWETPRDFFEKVNRRFHFTLDVCATKENSKCKKYYTKEEDALTKRWKGVCWMNPPYGGGIDLWLKKAYSESKKGAIVVCLVPARTDARWWHDYCMRGTIYFLIGKLTFVGARWNSPFPNALVIFGKAFNNSGIVRSLRRK